MSTRILLADDHGVLLAGLAALLNSEPGFEVIAEAGSGEEAVRLTLEKMPDLVLMDLSMPEIGGIEATRLILQQAPGVRVLILTLHEDSGLVREAIQAGASGYILKRAVKNELIQAIQTVMRGDVYVPPSLMRALVTDASPLPKASSPVEALTPREQEVLRLIARGNTNAQIAELLNLSVRTIEYHRANLTGKLGLHSRVELIRYAADKGLA